MKKLSLAAAILLSLTFMACNTSKNAADASNSSKSKNEKIKYVQGENYFVRNDFNTPKTTSLIVDSSAQLEKMMGSATLADRYPTEIDFQKQNVLLVIFPESNIDYKLIDVMRSGDKIEMHYTETTREDNNYTTRYYLMAIVDKSVQGDLYPVKH